MIIYFRFVLIIKTNWISLNLITILPNSLLFTTTCYLHFSLAMLSTIFPLPSIHFTIRPIEFTIALFLIINIPPYIPFTILPCEDSLTIHFIILPLTNKLPLISPYVFSLTFIYYNEYAITIYHIVQKITLVIRSIWPLEISLAFLLSTLKLTFVFCSIRPNLLSVSILKIIVPLPFISPSIVMIIHSKTMSSIRLPFSNVSISISMDESSLTMRTIIIPSALIEWSLWPYLFSKATPLPILPSSTVNSLIGENLKILKSLWPKDEGLFSNSNWFPQDVYNGLTVLESALLLGLISIFDHHMVLHLLMMAYLRNSIYSLYFKIKTLFCYLV